MKNAFNDSSLIERNEHVQTNKQTSLKMVSYDGVYSDFLEPLPLLTIIVFASPAEYK